MTNKMKRDYETLDAIQEAMGAMGPWHVIIAVALSLVNFPVAWNQLSIAFIAPPANFTCLSPVSVDNSTTSRCEVSLGNGTIEKCHEFEYDRSIFTETIITEWNLVCDRAQLANLAQSCTMFGILVGNMVFSAMADRIGRKIPLMIAVIIQSLTGLLSTFVPWYELFLVLKFVSAVATGGTMLITFVLLMEIVGIEWRATLSVLFHIPFLLGYLSNPLVSYLTRSWKSFQLAVSLPPILLLSYYWIIPESPRWLLAVGKVRKARSILTKAANRNEIPLEKVTLAVNCHEDHSKRRSERTHEKYNITHLFRTPNMRKKSICIAINWFMLGTCYFGFSQYISHLAGNIFINVAISAFMQLPGTLVVLLLISRVSRLKLLIGGNLLASCSLLLITLFDNSLAQISLSGLGLAGMSISFPTIYLYSGELFPTVVRNNGIGMCSVSARIGSMIAPFIATMGSLVVWLPPVLFGVGPLLGAALCFFLPETMNCELPETIEDGENFRKFDSNKSKFTRPKMGGSTHPFD
ncbi:organic cation transporter protein-like isoform X2 [Venturia canescens]|uniref:organic cation transporter protein-like isoform X2 n=1 Tax=Venturia canescens TaxID=32260 RepID=UPI001C9CB94D|nr:organic cation transporter protein-like isoform X2 [Venturia canescens]